MKNLQYYIGQACRRYRRGELDLTITELATQKHVNISRLSLFENGKVSSIKPLQYYLTAHNMEDTQNTEVLMHLLQTAILSYLRSENAIRGETLHES